MPSERIIEAARQNATVSVFVPDAIALLGGIGFPLYYWIWTSVWPQNYENLGARVLAGVLCVGVAVIHRSSSPRLKAILPVYWHFVMLYVVAWTTMMTLLNDVSGVWMACEMIAISLLVIFIPSVPINIALFVAGSAVGLLWAWGESDRELMELLPKNGELIPLITFALVGLNAFAYRYRQGVAEQERERITGARAMSGYLAHELRTPLQSIQSGAEALDRWVPDLINGYRVATESGAISRTIPGRYEQRIMEAPIKLAREATFAQTTIDIMLANARGLPAEFEPQPFRCKNAVQQALTRYPYRQGEMQRVNFEVHEDFEISSGGERLLHHVVFNLVKNALYVLCGDEQGRDCIRIDGGARKLIVWDNGPGMSSEQISSAFMPFWTSKIRGTGLGLAFCADAAQALGADIKVESEEGGYTRFTLDFSSTD